MAVSDGLLSEIMSTQASTPGCGQSNGNSSFNKTEHRPVTIGADPTIQKRAVDSARLETATHGQLNVRSSRIPGLDGLRAISICFVFLAHLTGTANFPKALQPLSHLGELGVHSFFVISGFLITSLLLKEQGKTGGISLINFYQRRLFRKDCHYPAENCNCPKTDSSLKDSPQSIVPGWSDEHQFYSIGQIAVPK